MLLLLYFCIYIEFELSAEKVIDSVTCLNVNCKMYIMSALFILPLTLTVSFIRCPHLD